MRRKARSRELLSLLTQSEAHLEALRAQLGAAEAEVEGLKRDKEENRERWAAARAERDRLRTQTDPQ